MPGFLRSANTTRKRRFVNPPTYKASYKHSPE